MDGSPLLHLRLYLFYQLRRKLLSAGFCLYSAQPRAPLGLDWGFPAGPRNPTSGSFVAHFTLQASRSLSLLDSGIRKIL